MKNNKNKYWQNKYLNLAKKLKKEGKLINMSVTVLSQEKLPTLESIAKQCYLALSKPLGRPNNKEKL